MNSERGKFAKDVYLANLLYDAIDDEDFSYVNNFLLTKQVNCNLVLPKKGIAPFHLVVGKETLDFAFNATNLMLQHGGDPNVRNEDGLTPLHITAAYGRIKILNLLLCSGGDPDMKDDNFKKPIHYAYEYGHLNCADLLLSFMEGQRNILNSDNSIGYDLTLEKILINSAANMGPYEIIQEYKTEPVSEKNLESIKQLPETNSTELVINWCQSHLQETKVEEPYVDNIHQNSINFEISAESSFNESENERSVTFNTKYVTFRKKFKKTRKTPSRNSSFECKEKNKKNTLKTPPRDDLLNISRKIDISELATFDTCSTTFHKVDTSSRESGIVTLPNSKNETFITVPTENLTMQSVPISLLENRENVDITNATSYFTPDLINNSILERNIFELTDDLTDISYDVNDWKNLKQSTKIGCSNFEAEEKLRRCSTKSAVSSTGSTDLSFRSISEIYKYIDLQENIVLFERRLIKATTSDYAGSMISSSMSSKVSSIPASIDYDSDTLRKELTSAGYNPGPITFTTKRVYLRKLMQLKKNPITFVVNRENTKKIYSVELEKTLRDQNWLKDFGLYKSLDEVISKEFATPKLDRKWREGVSKTSFTYLLLDPRITDNLPCRTDTLESKEVWEIFLSSIFYVGKGKRSRPYAHLYDAVKLWRDGKRTSTCKKTNHILNIWKDNLGVVCLHIFQNVIPVEAYTREAAIIQAIKVENLRNVKCGDFYGPAATWNQRQRKMFGVYLLYRAMMIFLNEGERQLGPNDIYPNPNEKTS